MRKLLLALFALSFVVYYTSKDSEAQNSGLFCLPLEDAINLNKQNKQQLVFSGINLNNQPFELWASEESYTLIVLFPDGTACSSLNLMGHTLANNIGKPL
ncbi:MAG: hypothetical protein EBV86_11340 [Marivivens sp.]|nr:hypothetical protein [Marivivens sp.]